MKLTGVLLSMLILLVACTSGDKKLHELSPEQLSEVNAGRIASFNSDELNPTEYVSWIRNARNGLLQEKTMEELVFTAQYKPYPYIACVEEKKKEITSTSLAQKITGVQSFSSII